MSVESGGVRHSEASFVVPLSVLKSAAAHAKSLSGFDQTGEKPASNVAGQVPKPLRNGE
jgi:hypothetical protein